MNMPEPPEGAAASQLPEPMAPIEPSSAEHLAGVDPNAPFVRDATPDGKSGQPAPVPLRPGQLSPGWRMVFIAGQVGVLAGFGALWQAGRIAGIAPWWLGPETNPRLIFVIALPFVAPLIALLAGVLGRPSACYVGIGAGLISASIALGDLHFPGLAMVDAIIGLCGIMLSAACLGGRMRAAPAEEPAELVSLS